MKAVISILLVMFFPFVFFQSALKHLYVFYVSKDEVTGFSIESTVKDQKKRKSQDSIVSAEMVGQLQLQWKIRLPQIVGT